jgi:hypothetical protein
MSETFRGFIDGQITKARNIKVDTIPKKEVVLIFEEFKKKFDEFYPKKIVRTEIKIIDGWKGEGAEEIYKGLEGDIHIRYYIKAKHSDEEDKEINKVVRQSSINRMIRIVKRLKMGEKYSCYDIADRMGVDWKEVWKQRSDIYFPEYYYPIKVLEALGLIKYEDRGGIERLK